MGTGRPFDRLRANGVGNCPLGYSLRPVSTLRSGREYSPLGAHFPFDFPQGERTPPPLWIPAFAGMTNGGAGPLGCWLRGNDESWGIAPILTFPHEGGRDSSPWPAPLGCCLRRNDAWERGGDERRGSPRAAPLPWIPAFAGTTRGRSAFSSCSERGFPPLHRPSGYRLSPVRRGAGG